MPFLLFLAILLFASCGSPEEQQQVEESPPPAADSIILASIMTTGRISSNHFSDVVVDTSGNSYIACFQKAADGRDYQAILKLSPNGEILWKIGAEAPGRACAISIGPEQQIWVTGFIDSPLEEKDRKSTDNNVFLARFDSTGFCSKLIHSTGTGIGFDCHVNDQGEVLISGIMGPSIAFGEKKLHNPSRNGKFLAKFSPDGSCDWIKAFSGDIQRIRSDEDGNFYATGSFYGKVTVGGETHVTQSDFDSDGFLIKILPDGEIAWWRQFGNPGTTRPGYRTSEGGQELIVQKDGMIWVATKKESPSSFTQPDEAKASTCEVVLVKFDPEGKERGHMPILTDIPPSLAFSFAESPSGNLWLGIRQEGQRSIVLKLNEEGRMAETLMPSHGENTLFRAAYPTSDGVVFTGHFQSYLALGQKSISNDGNHGLFWMRIVEP